MKNHADYLNQAMFIASESYSGSLYDLELSKTINCEDEIAFIPTNDQTTNFVLAA
ncbi:MAG: hypothetical protein WAO98_08420 [Alphaproteobacteria bacterium]